MINFNGIEVSYGDFTALPNFNLTINDGEFFTLLGPSGCGKSTALRTLAGFIQPSAGKILSDGREISRLHSSKRGIGMVFQNYALFPSMSVRENIAFGLKVAKVPPAEMATRVAEAGRKVNLSDEQMTKGIAELSGGQQQRVAIARALIMRPDILLLDEPLSNLDAQLRQQLRLQLKELQVESGITTIYVTHDQEEALSMSDRIAVLNRGKVEQVGTPDELYNASTSEFVCNFLGEVNCLSGNMIGALNAQGANLDTSKNHYIRLEKLKIRPLNTPPTGLPSVQGYVKTRVYQGASSVYSLTTPGGVLRSIRLESDGQIFAEGHPVNVDIDPQWILSFTPQDGEHGK